MGACYAARCARAAVERLHRALVLAATCLRQDYAQRNIRVLHAPPREPRGVLTEAPIEAPSIDEFRISWRLAREAPRSLISFR